VGLETLRDILFSYEARNRLDASSYPKVSGLSLKSCFR
jgi:hypothetical protein